LLESECKNWKRGVEDDLQECGGERGALDEEEGISEMRGGFIHAKQKTRSLTFKLDDDGGQGDFGEMSKTP
jgi:hypothetical protein